MNSNFSIAIQLPIRKPLIYLLFSKCFLSNAEHVVNWFFLTPSNSSLQLATGKLLGFYFFFFYQSMYFHRFNGWVSIQCTFDHSALEHLKQYGMRFLFHFNLMLTFQEILYFDPNSRKSPEYFTNFQIISLSWLYITDA